MATSGTYGFNLDITELMEEAFDLCGLSIMSGGDYNTAKRALDLIFLEWQNKGLNLWKVEQGSITLTAGTNIYDADSTALEIVDAVVRTDAGDVSEQFDQRLTRISRTEYNHQAKKLLQSKPTQYYVDKGLTLKIGIWATPDSQQTYTLIYDYIKRIEDAGVNASINPDVPARYLPCLTYALAYNIACKNDQSQSRIPMIKQRYDELWKEVSEADRERAAIRFVPNTNSY
jgi:hypothetical protein|tara:strand:+ start:10514 stop:11203 length:690 start_codon:yes stop_codon:yes gene_type:complete